MDLGNAAGWAQAPQLQDNVHNRAGDLFRLAAYSLHHDQTPMGDFLRRMKSKMDAPAATTATAHKIAIIF
jgi:hypothetical protein